MGNYSFLAKNQKDNPNYQLDWVFDYKEVEIVLASKYMVPALWCSAFQERDFKTCMLTFSDEEPYSHPVLMTRAEIGIELATSRRSKFCAMFSGEIDDTYDEWLKLLQLFKGYYIHMDWSDVATMADDGDEIDSLVKAGIRAFEKDKREDWVSFLALSNVTLNSTTGLATIGSGKSITRGFKAQCLYGDHVIKTQNAKGETEWEAVIVEDDSQKKP